MLRCTELVQILSLGDLRVNRVTHIELFLRLMLVIDRDAAGVIDGFLLAGSESHTRHLLGSCIHVRLGLFCERALDVLVLYLSWTRRPPRVLMRDRLHLVVTSHNLSDRVRAKLGLEQLRGSWRLISQSGYGRSSIRAATAVRPLQERRCSKHCPVSRNRSWLRQELKPIGRTPPLAILLPIDTSLHHLQLILVHWAFTALS